MIWTDERYRPCLEALEKEGLLDWTENGRSFRLRPTPAEFEVWTRDPGEEWDVRDWPTDREAEAMIERAAREWLEKRGVRICREEGDGGFYTAWRLRDNGAGRCVFVAAKGHAKTQAEAMFHLLSSGNAPGPDGPRAYRAGADWKL